MLVAIDWLSELLDPAFDAVPADEVARVLTSRGLTVDAVVPLEGTAPVLDVDVPANRPDCLGHLGIARELSAATGIPLRPRIAPPPPSGSPVAPGVEVRVEAPDLCGRYTARLVRGVRVGPSPDWVRRRLEACGLRSIDNVVDASNLVLLELGQPVHFFDFARLRGGTIVVRRGRPGEPFSTLDGIARPIDGETLVIADADGPVALAGIMGGADSEIRESTRDVLIEAAWFRPGSIRATARRLGMSTDASQRFERGCDPDAPPVAQDLAVRLLAELAGGIPAPGLVDVHPGAAPAGHRSVRLSRAALLLGYAPAADEALGALAAVGLRPERNGDAIAVTVPSWRVDLESEADLVEEIGRHLGYDRIPARSLVRLTSGPARHPPSPAEERTRDLLAHLGFAEAFNYAMIASGADDPFVPSDTPPPAILANPIADNLSHLRRAVAPGLLASADLNLRRGNTDVRLFEVGRVFLPGGTPGAFPEEPLRAAIAWTGAAAARHWSAPARDTDLHDLAGIVETVVRSLRPGAAIRRGPSPIEAFHPGRSTGWRAADGRLVAWGGLVHPALARRLDLPHPIWIAEIDLDSVGSLPAPKARYAPIARVPGVSRDLTIRIAAGTPVAVLLDALAEVPSPAPAAFEVIDLWRGKDGAQTEASITVRVMLQPLERTLTDAQTESYRMALIGAVERVEGARIRN